MQKIEKLLGALQGEGRYDDIAAAPKAIGDRVIKLVDRRLQLPVQPIAIGRFHDHDVHSRRCGGSTEQRASGGSEVAGEQHATSAIAFLQLRQYARRTEDMTRVEKGDVDSFGELERLIVNGGAPKNLECI